MAEWWGQHRLGGEESSSPEASDQSVEHSLPILCKPIASSVLWTPKVWESAEPQEACNPDLFVWQAALKEITEDLSAPGGRERYGMLSGRLLRCPESDTSYVSIEEAHPAPHAMPESEDPVYLARFREFWLSVSMKVSAQERTLVGWYHSHPRLGVSLSKSDERLHLTHFPNRWQCALVFTSQTSRREAGFFQRDPKTGAFRSTPSAFYEVLPVRKLNGGRATSWVGWSNYKPDRSVKDPGRRAREAAFELVVDALEDADEADLDALPGIGADGSNGNKGRANGDEASAETGGAPAPSVLLPELLKAGKAQRRRRRIRRLAAAASIIVATAVGLAAALATGRVDLMATSRRIRLPRTGRPGRSRWRAGKTPELRPRNQS
jgi:proteasome lid subunit RPN8/RPN11